jgi:hypothetical protein
MGTYRDREPMVSQVPRAETDAMPEYSAEPSLQDVPLNPSEIEAYAADPSEFARDPRKVGHLLRRVSATVMLYKNQIQSLNRDVQDIQMSRSRAGAATTMSPRDAVRFLSPVELASVVEGTHRALLEHVLSLQTDAKQAKREAVSEQNKARFVLLSVLEDTTIPQETRERVKTALAALPAEHFAPAPETPSAPTEEATDGAVAAEPGAELTGTQGATTEDDTTSPMIEPEVPVVLGGLEDLFADSEDEQSGSGSMPREWS